MTCPPGIRAPADPVRRSAALRGGFTLLELLVTISIITLLLAILLPTIGMIRDLALRTSCANHQRQIVLAMNAYAIDCEGLWPVIGSLGGNWIWNGIGELDSPIVGDSLASTSMASLEFLNAQSGNALPISVFACPAQPEVRPPGPAAPITYPQATGLPGGIDATWADTSSPYGPNAFAYAYDWSVPVNLASTSRVVLGDRPRENTVEETLMSHRKKAVVCFGDSRTSVLVAMPTLWMPGIKTCQTADQLYPLRDARFDNPDTGWPGGPDNVYDDAADGWYQSIVSSMCVFRAGSTTRCFLK